MNKEKRVGELTTSIYKGISWAPNTNTWRARIKINRNDKHLGYFDCEVEAAKAYDDAGYTIRMWLF